MQNKESIDHRIPEDVQEAWNRFQSAEPECKEHERCKWEQLRDSYAFSDKRAYLKDDKGNFIKKQTTTPCPE